MPSRRDALRQLTLSAAAIVSAPGWVENLLALSEQHAAHRAAAGPAAAPEAWTPKVLNPHQNELVIAASELIIPATETPGAAAAQVNRYIDGVLAEAKPEDRDAFLQGLAWLDMRSEARFSRQFVNATPDQQIELLTALSTASNPVPEDTPGVDAFRTLKAMTIAGYYTSEVGLLQEIGDDGQMFLLEFKGCTHKEHGAS